MDRSAIFGATYNFSYPGRVAAGLLALTAWLGLARYFLAEVSKQRGDLFAALWINTNYLTDLSNLFLAIVMTGVAFGYPALSRPVLVGWAVAAITTVGVGFWLIGGTLTLGSALENILLHGVTPWAALLLWLVFVPKGYLRLIHVSIWLLWPLCYWLYALTRGVLTGEFAYGFMDPSKNSVTAIATLIGGLTLVYAAWAWTLLALDKMSAKK